MDNVFMVWIFEDLRGGEGIVAFESVVVECRGTEDVVWLFEKPRHLRAWENDLRFAGDVREDVGHVLLAILCNSVSSRQ